jgi:hypothetical protein
VRRCRSISDNTRERVFAGLSISESDAWFGMCLKYSTCVVQIMISRNDIYVVLLIWEALFMMSVDIEGIIPSRAQKA